MSPLAIALRGIPPYGLGVYSRYQPDAPGPWHWRTGRQWIFVGISRATPDLYEASLASAIETAKRTGASGILINPENGWRDESDAACQAFGARLAAAAEETRVGVVSHPGLTGRMEVIASEAGGAVWWSVELFYDEATNARAWDRWRSFAGFRLLPTVAGYFAGPHTPPELEAQRRSPEGYDAYIRSIPMAPGAIVWPAWPMPEHMTRSLARRYGGAGHAAMIVAALLSIVTSSLGVAGAILTAALLLISTIGFMGGA